MPRLLVPSRCRDKRARRSSPSDAPRPAAESSSVDRPQYPSSYTRHPNPPVAITNATIMTAAGAEIAHGTILLRDGRIVAVGTDVQVPPDALRVEGTGKYVTPGIIDPHSHLGVYAAPGTEAESDGNEMTDPVTAEVWAEHSFWPQDPQIPLAIAGGVHDHPGAAGLGQPDRRAQCGPQADPRAHRSGDEISRRPLRSQDGLR